MNNDDRILERLDELVRLMAIVAKRGARQTEIIHELGDQGFGPKRIAELLGTTPNTVSVALHKKRRESKRSK